ncbi:MAG: hypothetical protein M0C28_32940 [Candidatus Moduliflexus flocculans]|nr:hypothetical protein [Candidatus Moduliflexus flocculans]
MRTAPSSRTVPNPGSGDLFAFLGIDVQAKTGPCVMTVKLRRAGGTVESVRKDLEIVERKFPSTKLQFKPEYVTPPASLQARIKRNPSSSPWPRASSRRSGSAPGLSPFPTTPRPGRTSASGG